MNKNLYLAIFLLIISGLNISFAEKNTFEDPKGYKDLLWGDTLESVQANHEFYAVSPSKDEINDWAITRNKEIKLYSEISDNKFIKETKYLFYKEKLVKVIVDFRNSVEDYKHEEIKKSLIKKMIEKHGESYNESKFSRWRQGDFREYKINFEEFTWEFKTTTVKLIFIYYDKTGEAWETTVIYEMKGLKIEKENIDEKIDF